MLRSFRSRVKDDEILSSQLLKLLIIVTILINGYGLFSPIFGSNDSVFYALIDKNIVLSKDWINLTFAGHDWLDKPHFTFWITALSYKLFGISVFSYILPGFLFSLLGGVYTYKLGDYLYNRQVGYLSLLLYVSSIHIMLSAIDVRQEAFLLGEITPACYYWLRYYKSEKITVTNLLYGAFFTALAIMTKGIFTIITIFSGIVVVSFYLQQLKSFFTKKWLYAFILLFIFILPELICLYLQFDLHPEKLIFGRHGVSGLKFFFWDSQFGRFFDNGPYVNLSHNQYSHYFFFIHTFLWSFLPWSVIFVFSLFRAVGLLRLNNDNIQVREQKINQIFLLSSFFITFILFSLTRFQLDYYINILVPFAAILCATWIHSYLTRLDRHRIFHIQIWLSIILVGLVLILSMLIFEHVLAIFCIVMVVVIAFIGFFKNRLLNKAIVFPVLAINLVFVFVMMVNNQIYINYAPGYQIANYLKTQDKLLLVDYQLELNSLEFYTAAPYLRADSLSSISNINHEYYLVIADQNFMNIESVVPGAKLLKKFKYLPQNKFPSLLLNSAKLNNAVDTLSLYRVNK